MKKRTKLITISISLLVILSVGISLVIWGMQPLPSQEITFYQLQTKLSKYFPIPNNLPFEGTTACTVDYIKGHDEAVLTRFEVSPKKARGYTIALSDDNRKITIQANGLLVFSDPDNTTATTYNDLSINYMMDAEGWLYMLFKIEENTFALNAHYNSTLPKETIVSDISSVIDALLAQKL